MILISKYKSYNKYFNNSCEKVLKMKVEHDFNNKSKSRKFSLLVKKSYNKTVIDFNFGRNEDLSTLKSNIYFDLAALVNYHFFGEINPHVYLMEVNNCIVL